jgi:predicted DNA binding CopG/RHH family protein
MAKNEQRDLIPERFDSIEAAAEFWDSHDLADYEDQTTHVDFTVNFIRQRRLIAIDPELAKKIANEASRRGLATETLINLWLNERLHSEAA